MRLQGFTYWDKMRVPDTRVRHRAFQVLEQKGQPRHKSPRYVIQTFDLLDLSQRVALDLDQILPSPDYSLYIR